MLLSYRLMQKADLGMLQGRAHEINFLVNSKILKTAETKQLQLLIQARGK